MSVSIIKTNIKNIDRNLTKALNLIDYKPKKKKILIKPNLVYGANPKSGIITTPILVEALIKYFKKFNCEIIIGEGSGVGHNSLAVFEKTGYKKLAEKYNIKLVDLNNVERKIYKWKYGKIKIPKLLDKYEYINVPTLKTHTLTTISVATKNQKGLLDWDTKKSFHNRGLDESILELGNIIKPSLIVVNGLFCLEGNSLSLINKAKKLKLIIAGTDLFEVDNIAIKIMDINQSKIKHFPIIKNIKILGEDIGGVKNKFIEPQKVRKIFNMEFQLNGCSGCSVNMERTLKSLIKRPLLLVKFLYLALFKNITFVSGKELKKELRKDTKVVYLGNCTKIFSQEKYIGGCPPDPKQIIEAIKKL